MASKASMRKLSAGDRTSFTNHTGTAVQFMLRTDSGSMVRTTVPIGATVDVVMGRENGVLYILEPEQAAGRLRMVASRTKS